MYKFKFPKVIEPSEKKVSFFDQTVGKIDAIVLFRVASNTNIDFSHESYEMTFDDKDKIRFLDLMDWIAAYYQSKNNV